MTQPQPTENLQQQHSPVRPIQPAFTINPASIQPNLQSPTQPQLQPQQPAQSRKSEASTAHFTSIPISRIKKIIKEDEDLMRIQPDAVFCVSVAVEKFLSYFVKHAWQYTKRDSRKTVLYRDLVHVVKEVEQMMFLEDVIPTPVLINKALEERDKAFSKGKIPAEAEETPNEHASQNEALTDPVEGEQEEEFNADDAKTEPVTEEMQVDE